MTDPASSAFDRRHVIAGIGALLVGGCGGGSQSSGGPPVALPAAPTPAPVPAPAPGPTGSISAAARSRGRRWGSMVAWNGSTNGATFQNPQYSAIMDRDCQLVVAENEMKWQALRPAADRFNWGPADAIVGEARRRGMVMRGHTLLWHRPQWFPQWLNTYDYGANPVAEGERLLTDHIRQVMRRYAGMIDSWDVVNETINTDTGGLMETSLSRALRSGEAVLDLAFQTARAEAPQAELVYNDYMSWEPGQETHRTGVLRLLEGFRRRGTPVDALGVQSHIEMRSLDPATGLGPYQERAWRQFLDEVVAMGYKLVITELDVKDNALPADFARRDAGVAAYLNAYLDVMFSYPQLKDVLAWGMVDRFSWLQGFSPRSDGLELRCCPYDSAYAPKAMRDTLIRRFTEASAI
jgi:endo-1,4-beta-xylanase